MVLASLRRFGNFDVFFDASATIFITSCKSPAFAMFSVRDWRAASAAAFIAALFAFYYAGESGPSYSLTKFNLAVALKAFFFCLSVALSPSLSSFVAHWPTSNASSSSKEASKLYAYSWSISPAALVAFWYDSILSKRSCLSLLLSSPPSLALSTSAWAAAAAYFVDWTKSVTRSSLDFWR